MGACKDRFCQLAHTVGSTSVACVCSLGSRAVLQGGSFLADLATCQYAVPSVARCATTSFQLLWSVRVVQES